MKHKYIYYFLYALNCITCLFLSFTSIAQLNGGSVSFQGGGTVYKDCSRSSKGIVNNALATGGSGNYIYYWEKKVDTSGWTLLYQASPSSVVNASVEYGKAVYYRRKVKDTQNVDSAYSNQVFLSMYGVLYGSISFSTNQFVSVVPVGTPPDYIKNVEYAWVENPPLWYEWEKKTGINGQWKDVPNSFGSGKYGLQPDTETTADTFYYRRYVLDGCDVQPGASLSVKVITTNTLLPVIWVSVNAFKKDNNIELEWKVANENNNAYFEIWRSSDGLTFTKIANVESKGNSITNVSYNYTDLSVNTNVNNVFYRIKHVDKDGKYSVSSTINVKMKQGAIIDIYPNPVKNILTITSDKLIKQFAIKNLSGQIVYEQTKASNSSLVNISSFAKGVYLLTAILTQGEEQTVRFVKE